MFIPLCLWIIYFSLGVGILYWDTRNNPLDHDNDGLLVPLVVILLWPLYVICHGWLWLKERIITDTFN